MTSERSLLHVEIGLWALERALGITLTVCFVPLYSLYYCLALSFVLLALSRSFLTVISSQIF